MWPAVASNTYRYSAGSPFPADKAAFAVSPTGTSDVIAAVNSSEYNLTVAASGGRHRTRNAKN